MSPKLTKKEIKLFNALHDDQVEDAKTFSKPKYAMYWASIVDKYKEKAHFVYELLQNADDAQATQVEFQLENDRLIFRHNGTIGFSVTADDDKKGKGHINAITGIGWSTKDKDTEKIGKFGVGFKAVFQYTKEPRIYDDKFWFKIEDYIVPAWLNEDFPGRREGETVFVFPFTNPKTAFADVSRRLLTLNNPILFLRHLQKVTINIRNKEQISYSKEIVEHEVLNGISHELMNVDNNHEILSIHMFTKSINLNYKGQKSTQNISVGYLLNKDGEIEYRGNFKVFCFFPTEEDFDLRCLVHAPFLLVDSRQSIKDDNINTLLKSKLAELASEALLILRDYGIKHKHLLINENIFHMIPSIKRQYGIYGTEEMDDPFRECYLNVIRDENLLLSRESEYISCEEALICQPLSLMSIISDKQLNQLYQGYDEEFGDEPHERHFLVESIQRIYNQNYVSSVLEDLEVDTFTGSDLASLITQSFMDNQGFKWAKRLYSHLRNEERRLFKRTNTKAKLSETPFCLSPIILTTDDTWVAPYRKDGVHNVYLPLKAAAEGYTFVSSKYVKDNELRLFLDDLGIKAPDAWDYIQSVVLKGYDADNISQDKLRNDFVIVYDYINNLKGEERKGKLSVISNNFYVYCGNEKAARPAYTYDNIDWLKTYLGDTVNYIDTSFYKDFIDGHSLPDFQNFIHELGVKQGPEVEIQKNCWLTYADKQRFGIENYSTATVVDYELTGFKEWKKIDLNTSKTLWTWLVENYPLIESHKEAECSYQYYRWYKKTAQASFLIDLKTKAWVFNAKGQLLPISKVHLEDLEAMGYLIDVRLIKLLGIERGTKPLEELGASESQIAQNKLGQTAEELGLNTPDKLKKAFEALKREEEQEQSNDRQHVSSHKQQMTSNSNEEELSFHGKQRKTNIDELSASTKEYNTNTDSLPKTISETVDEITKKFADETNKKIEEEQKRANVSNLTKYSKSWFDSLLDLEYGNAVSETDYSRISIKIIFSRFHKEKGSEHVYILSNPSRNIPVWIEEVSGLTVKFTFFNRDDIAFTFDVANVKDFNLRVKAKDTDVKSLDSLDWTKCVRAIVEINNPNQIVGKLKNAFKNMPFDSDYNFKDNLDNRLCFVFGPPGTGKTTRLADIIKKKMSAKNCKILVLAPTNKACDVLTKSIIRDGDYYPWLGRFVATGEEELENSEILIDRSSELANQNKCCIVSTIARLSYDGFTDVTGGKLLKDIKWAYIIVDEASMIPLVQIVFAIYKLSYSKFIVAGDPMQISPIVKEKDWVGENIYTMVKLDNFDKATTEPIQFEVERLKKQYRSIPSIGNLYSYYCYDGKLVHARQDSDQRKLPMGKLQVQPVNFIPFRVERYDSIFGIKKLQGSNIHIYSALFTVETCVYIAKQQKENARIGIVCPYAAQAQLINKLIEQRTDLPNNVEVVVGTIHGFQGDQCEIILAVFNPPKGIGIAPERIMLNNKNVLNVAISRASDYLFVLLPHPDSYGYNNLIEINKLASIVKQHVRLFTIINADNIEKKIFSNGNFIESNTFVTNHQVANVYTKAACRYEVRIDENAVDIQIGENDSEGESLPSENTTSFNDDENLNTNHSDNDDNRIGHVSIMDNISSVLHNYRDDKDRPVKLHSGPAIPTKEFETSEEYVKFFLDKKVTIDEALDLLIKDNTVCSLYVTFLVLTSRNFRSKFKWRDCTRRDIESRKHFFEKIPNSQTRYTWLINSYVLNRFPIKGITNKPVDEVTFSIFKEALKNSIAHSEKRKRNKGKTIQSHKNAINLNSSYRQSSNYSKTQDQPNNDNLYDKFEYGMSDWD